MKRSTALTLLTPFCLHDNFPHFVFFGSVHLRKSQLSIARCCLFWDCLCCTYCRANVQYRTNRRCSAKVIGAFFSFFAEVLVLHHDWIYKSVQSAFIVRRTYLLAYHIFLLPVFFCLLHPLLKQTVAEAIRTFVLDPVPTVFTTDSTVVKLPHLIPTWTNRKQTKHMTW